MHGRSQHALKSACVVSLLVSCLVHRSAPRATEPKGAAAWGVGGVKVYRVQGGESGG